MAKLFDELNKTNSTDNKDEVKALNVFFTRLLFCLFAEDSAWIEDSKLDEALKIDEIKTRIEQVKNFRINGGEVARTLVDKSHQFRYRNELIKNQIVVPYTSSENCNYIPCDIFDNSHISLNSRATCKFTQKLAHSNAKITFCKQSSF